MMRHKFSQNFLIFLLSLGLAFLFWVAATETENPTLQQELSDTLVLTVKDLDSDRYAYGHETVRVHVTARAPKSVWESLASDDVTAVVDVSGLPLGTHVVPIEVRFKRRPMQQVRIQPDSVAITLEPRQTREVPVEIVTRGTPALGYQVQALNFTPQKVIVSGPASSVERVQSARVVLDISERRQSLQQDYRLVSVDKNGDPVPYITCDPAQVTVSLTVEQLGNYRDMAIKVQLRGQPAPGYRVTRVEVDPLVVTAFGPTDLIRAMEGYIETAPVNLNQLTESISLTVLLQVPSGLSVLLPAPQVQVAIHVEAIQGSLTLERPVEIQGADSTTVTVAPSSVSIILSGPLPILDRLDPNTVHAIVDVTGLTSGEHVVDVRVIAPPNLNVNSILPQTLSVVVNPPP